MLQKIFALTLFVAVSCVPDRPNSTSVKTLAEKNSADETGKTQAPTPEHDSVDPDKFDNLALNAPDYAQLPSFKIAANFPALNIDSEDKAFWDSYLPVKGQLLLNGVATLDEHLPEKYVCALYALAQSTGSTTGATGWTLKAGEANACATQTAAIAYDPANPAVRLYLLSAAARAVYGLKAPYSEQITTPVFDIFTAWGFTQMQLIYIADGSLVAIVAKLQNKAFVFFQGTQSAEAEKDNFRFSQISATDLGLATGPLVHSGFSLSVKSAREMIFNKLKSYPQLTEIEFVGHSRGGALAALFAVAATKEFSVNISAIGFGVPRVGNPGFAAQVLELMNAKLKIAQYVNGQDPVAYLSPTKATILGNPELQELMKKLMLLGN